LREFKGHVCSPGPVRQNQTGMYACRFCGRVEARPLAICPDCGTWGSFRPIEELRPSRPRVWSSGPLSLGLLDRLVGRVPPGTVLLLGGEPGVGKSTLALSVASAMAKSGPVLYVCGEEKAAVVEERANRVGATGLRFLEEYLVGRILRAAEGYRGLVVDSLPTVAPRASLSPGGPTAQREAAMEFVRFARKTGCVVLLVTQMAKKGLSGPKMVEHIVDVVLMLTKSADGGRLLRVAKNRFGPATAALALKMTSVGLLPLGSRS